MEKAKYTKATNGEMLIVLHRSKVISSLKKLALNDAMQSSTFAVSTLIFGRDLTKDLTKILTGDELTSCLDAVLAGHEQAFSYIQFLVGDVTQNEVGDFVGQYVRLSLDLSKSSTLWLGEAQDLLLLHLESDALPSNMLSSLKTFLLADTFQRLTPYFAFSERYDHFFETLIGAEVYPHLDVSQLRSRPWSYYWHSVVYGSELTQAIGIDYLRATPAFSLIELDGPLFWISDTYGVGKENFYTYAEGNLSFTNHPGFVDSRLKKLLKMKQKEHEENVSSHLHLLPPYYIHPQ
jgi:hypothetical protein